MSGMADAAVDVRKACNGIKRTSCLAAASLTGGFDPKDLAGAAQDMALEVLKSIGFDVGNDDRVRSVMPMVLEATSGVIFDAARSGAASLEQIVRTGVEAMTAVAKSRAVVRAMEPLWPGDMDSVTSMRITTAAAMSHVAVEVDAFDFMHAPSECIKEATKLLVKASTDTSRRLAPPQSSAAARLMLTQTLMQSSARMFAAVWKGYAQHLTAELDAMGEVERNARLEQMEATPISKHMETIAERFLALLASVSAEALDVCLEPAAERSRQNARPRHR